MSPSEWAAEDARETTRLLFDAAVVAITPRTFDSDLQWLPPRPAPAPDSIERFLGWLFDGTEGLIETRALPSRERLFWRHDQLRALARYADIARTREDLYFGVSTRADSTGGSLTNCRDLPALFVDLDFKVVPEEEARRRLATFPRRPSAIIASGGGLHVYWRLTIPIDLRTDARRATRLLRGLATALGGDHTAAEPARILRLPRTCNHKYRPVRPVALEAIHVER